MHHSGQGIPISQTGKKRRENDREINGIRDGKHYRLVQGNANLERLSPCRSVTMETVDSRERLSCKTTRLEAPVSAGCPTELTGCPFAIQARPRRRDAADRVNGRPPR